MTGCRGMKGKGEARAARLGGRQTEVLACSAGMALQYAMLGLVAAVGHGHHHFTHQEGRRGG